MSTALEEMALDEALDFAPRCGFEDPPGTPCENAATWARMLVPCGCVTLACDPCKRRREARYARDARSMLMLCAKHLGRIRGMEWEPL